MLKRRKEERCMCLFIPFTSLVSGLKNGTIEMQPHLQQSAETTDDLVEVEVEEDVSLDNQNA